MKGKAYMETETSGGTQGRQVKLKLNELNRNYNLPQQKADHRWQQN